MDQIGPLDPFAGPVEATLARIEMKLDLVLPAVHELDGRVSALEQRRVLPVAVAALVVAAVALLVSVVAVLAVVQLSRP